MKHFKICLMSYNPSSSNLTVTYFRDGQNIEKVMPSVLRLISYLQKNIRRPSNCGEWRLSTIEEVKP